MESTEPSEGAFQAGVPYNFIGLSPEAALDRGERFSRDDYCCCGESVIQLVDTVEG